MENNNKKINPYLIIILVLVLVVGGFAYDKWGKGFLSNSTENTGGKENVNVDTGVSGEDIVVGNSNASVTIVEYYSYFCGYCKLFHDDTYPKILENFINTGKVKYVFRPFPPYELGASILCANEQGKFSEYHQELFTKAGELKQAEDLKGLAKGAGLDEEKFNQCFDSQKYSVQSQKWYTQAGADFDKVGVPEEERGTPTFFVNGEMLVGAQPYEKFVEVIEKKLGE